MKKTRVLVVDDEMSILRYVSACLRREGYEVVTASDGQEGLLVAEQENPTLVILDIKMPRLDGFKVCRRLREWTEAPIIMLSAIEDEREKVRCLNSGADDYVTKPFSIEELLARVKAVLRRMQAIATPPVRPTFRSGNVEISFAERRVAVDNKEVKLTPTEYNLLQELVLNAEKILTYDHLLNRIWGPEYREEREYLYTFVRRLRRKLQFSSAQSGFIVTVPGVGYRFTS